MRCQKTSTLNSSLVSTLSFPETCFPGKHRSGSMASHLSASLKVSAVLQSVSSGCCPLVGAVINLLLEYCCKTSKKALWSAALQIVQTCAVSMFTPSLKFAFEARYIIPEKCVGPRASAPPPLTSRVSAGNLL